MDQPKISRVLRLMRLMSGPVNYSVDELAEKMETSYRSIYRYIDTFKEAGFAVEKIHGNVYRIVKMPRQFKDIENLVFFSEEEARLVNGLIESLDATNSLKANLHRKLAAIYDMTTIADYVDSKSNAANVQALGEAIRDRRKAVLKNYASATSGTSRDRLVEPFGFTTNYIDVWAYDIEKGDNRIFKIARIDWVDVLPEEWEHEDGHRKGYLDAFRMQSFSQTRVRLEMNLRAKDLLCEEFPLAVPDVREENGKWVLDTMVSRMEGVGRFVIGLAADIKVIDSPELEEYVRNYADKYLKKND